MITEDYISFETAKLLKEKGFDENTPVNYFVGDDKPRGCVVGEMIYHKRAEEDTHLIACPTLQMAMKWLMEVHDIYIDVLLLNHSEEGIYGYVIQNITSRDYIATSRNNSYNTYVEAAEEAIKYCLENLI